jgi:hypothetical protein
MNAKEINQNFKELFKKITTDEFLQMKNLSGEIPFHVFTYDPADEVSIHLKTNNNEDYISNSKEAFADMMDSFKPLGISLTYEFDEELHDRSINLNNG